MVNSLPSDFCPYKGLQPYTEQDRAFFFGRERDQQIIISNLYAAQLTTLYGASGVGKSSVLLAGAVPLLKKERNLSVVVFRNWQNPGFLLDLKKTTLQAVNDSSGREITVDLSLPLDEFLAQILLLLRGPIFFIFDQFEEYFLYNPVSAGAAADFEAEFARAVNRKDVTVNFLLSMREDSLSKLDRFQGRIPTLLNNMLRLEHLDRESARQAITGPLDEYNRQLENSQDQVTIEKNLVEAVLDDLATGKVSSEQAGQGQVGLKSESGSPTPIETPFLQMVLTRLWDEERGVSHVLRLQTFEALGRGENIARTHLDSVMAKLTDPERETAANILRYLVTPSGAKIAQEPGALASWTDLSENQVQTILNRLSAADMRILRTVQTPGQPVRFEIFHDVLAQAILNWRTRYVLEQKRLESERQMAIERARAEELLARQHARTRFLRLVAAGLLLLSVLMIYLAIKAYLAKFMAHSRELAAYSRSQLKTDPELSLLLAIEAIKKKSTLQSIAALKDALLESQVSAVLDAGTKPIRIADAAFSPDGKYVVTASWDHTARVWDAATGKSVSVLAGAQGHQAEVNSASFSHDGKYVVTGSWDHSARVWEGWQTNKPVVVAILTENKDIWTTAFSPDGDYILTGGGEGKVRVWEWKKDPPSVKAELTLGSATLTPGPEPNSVPASGTGIPARGTNSNSLSSPDASPSPSPTPTRIILVFKAEFSPDGEFIIIAGKDRKVLVWDWKPKETNNRFTLQGHRFAVYDAAFSADGEYAVTGSDDKTAAVWEWKKPEQRNKPTVVLNLLPNSVRGVAFSPDGRLVATASDDGVARLWEWRLWRSPPQVQEEKRRQPIELRGQQGLLFHVAFSRDGQFLVTSSSDGTARVWRVQRLDKDTLDRLSVDDLLKLAKTRATRQLTVAERATYVDDQQSK